MACGLPSRLGSQISATRVGSGSSSSGEANAIDANNNARPSTLTHRVGREFCDDDDDDNNGDENVDV